MREKDYLVLDIGTEAVKSAIFKKENHKSIILGANTQYYDRFGVFDSRNFEQDVIKKAILKAIENLRSQTKIKTKSVFLGLPSDVLKGRVSLQSLERKNHKKIIDKREEKEIRDEVFRNSKKEISENFFQEAGILPPELEFLEQVFLEIKIDGYEVISLLSYQGKKVEVRVLSLFSAREYLYDFQRIFEELGLKVLKIIYPVQNLTKVFADKDGIFIDIGGKITQIFVVKNGKLQYIADFPMGGEDFSKILWQKLGLQEKRARIMKERYSNGEMTEKTRKEFNKIFSEVSEEWHRNLELRLEGCRGFLPTAIFLFGGGSQLPEIQEVLEDRNFEILKNPQKTNLILLAHDE